MAKNNIPVYLFTGFLEGGKTHMIQESLQDQRFNSGEKTLIIMCEEGIEELEPEKFWGKNCRMALIGEESELTEEKLTELINEHKTDRIIIEYNGMWQLRTLFDAMPGNWYVFQEMMFADAGTFINYNANMRQLMVDKLMTCEMVILNRTPNDIDKQEVHKIVRGVSRRAQICYDYPDGHVEYDEIQDPLPFDINAPVIEIKDEDYALWYRDLSEELDKYNGKTVKFKGLVARNVQLKKNETAVGRHIMTCCEADIAYNGIICVFDKNVDFKTKDWITVTAKIKVESHKLYGGKGPILYATGWERAEAPAQEVATFY